MLFDALRSRTPSCTSSLCRVRLCRSLQTHGLGGLVRHASTAAIETQQHVITRALTRPLAGAVGGGGVLALSLLWQSERRASACAPIGLQLASAHSASTSRAQSIGALIETKGRLWVALSVFWRCLELLWQLAPVVFTLPLLHSPLRLRWLALLRRTLERCGPVGIKWGQWASTRYDLFEDDLCDELHKLTNSAPAHSIAHTRAVVAADFGCELSDLFATFEDKPMASGSIGQVHLATLKHAHGRFERGRKVAVKVQHPNLAERLTLDMAILMSAADLVGSVAGVRIHETVAQFASNFYMQLDFRDEAANLRRFQANFGSAFWAAIVSFPQPIEGGPTPLVSEHVVVETFEAGDSVAEYLKRGVPQVEVKGWKRVGTKWVPADGSDPTSLLPPGAEADDAKAAEFVLLRKKVGVCGVQSYIKMVMLDNFVHADLHPGNVLVRMEEVGLLARFQRFILLGGTWEEMQRTTMPHIVFLDAGLAATFDDRIYSNVQGFFTAIVEHKGPEFGRAILGLNPTQPHVLSEEAFIQEVTQKMGEMRAQLLRGEGRAGDNIRSFMASVRNHNVSLDPTVMVALMSMMVLEGWQWRLDPSVGILDAIEMQLNRKASLAGWLLSAAEVYASFKAKYLPA